jgi:hypothetical protein
MATEKAKKKIYGHRRPIDLTPEQEMQVIENMIANWSPFGLAKRYEKEGLKNLADLFTEAANIAET